MSQTGYEKMCKELTDKFAEQLAVSLPRVIDGVISEERDGSFTVTVQCGLQRKKGEVTGYKLSFKPRERVPLESIDYKLEIGDDRQLIMFEAV